MPRIRNKARLAGVLLTVFLLYWGLLPWFWPEPKLSVEMPAQATLDADVPIRITLRAWHPNFKFMSVRFYVDHTRTDAEGPDGLFYPQMLYQSGEPTGRWPVRSVNRFSWPRQRTLEVSLPLKELAAQGLAGPGTIHGKIDVTINYPDVIQRYASAFGGYSARTRTLSEPFQLEVLETSDRSA
jgi:hypothetical protein